MAEWRKRTHFRFIRISDCTQKMRISNTLLELRILIFNVWKKNANHILGPTVGTSHESNEDRRIYVAHWRIPCWPGLTLSPLYVFVSDRGIPSTVPTQRCSKIQKFREFRTSEFGFLNQKSWVTFKRLQNKYYFYSFIAVDCWSWRGASREVNISKI